MPQPRTQLHGRARMGTAYGAINEAKPSTLRAIQQGLTSEALRRALARNMNAPGMAGWSHRRARDRLMRWNMTLIVNLKADENKGDSTSALARTCFQQWRKNRECLYPSPSLLSHMTISSFYVQGAGGSSVDTEFEGQLSKMWCAVSPLARTCADMKR